MPLVTRRKPLTSIPRSLLSAYHLALLPINQEASHKDLLTNDIKTQRRVYDGIRTQSTEDADSIREASNDYPDTTWSPESDSGLCKHCRNLDLVRIFTTPWKTREECIGTVDEFRNPDCAFCAIIWRSIRLHWDPDTFLRKKTTPPKLFVQNSWWCSFLEPSTRSRRSIFRVILAIEHGVQAGGGNNGNNRLLLSEMETVSEVSFRVPVPRNLDYDRLSHLLHQCDELERSEKATTSTNASLFDGGFRLIDVQEWMLVAKTTPCEYVALSYVWGPYDSTRLRTETANLECLKQPGALRESEDRFGKRLPRTIRDAIMLCQKLGRRYLWVDMLCILQDDPAEKMRLIHGMNRVFEGATLTLIAMAGAHADAGIPGVEPRESLPCEKIHTLHTDSGPIKVSLARASLEDRRRQSLWNSRGWTYQEQALSGKRLYFSSEEIFYECQSGCRAREGYNSGLEAYEERSTCPPWLSPGFSLHLEKIRTSYRDAPLKVAIPDARSLHLHFGQYASAVLNYCERDLSYPQDTLNAFTGIYNCFAGFTSMIPSKNGHLVDPGIAITQGIPLHLLPWALLWTTGTKQSSLRPVPETLKLSSWSWPAWKAAVHFVHAPNVGKVEFERDFPCPSIVVKDSIGMVEDWLIVSSDHGNTDTPGRYSTPLAGRSIGHLRHILPATKRSIPQPCLHCRDAGILEFTAPSLPISALRRQPGWVGLAQERTSPGHWMFTFSDDSNPIAYIQTDLIDQAIDNIEFIFLMADTYYHALCVQTTDGVSRKVGVAQFKIWKAEDLYQFSFAENAARETIWETLGKLGVRARWTTVHLH